MRTTTQPQLQLGEIDIANIKIDPRSRDDIPQLLKGLQYLYSDKFWKSSPPKRSAQRWGAPA